MDDTPTILPLKLDKVCFDAGGVRLIDNFSATFSSGGRSIFLGPNGAGKSLILRLCHGLIRPKEGKITWRNVSSPDEQAVRSRQAMVFQRPVMLRRTAAANIEYALSLRKQDKKERRFLLDEALEKAGLVEQAQRPARVPSVGEQQRLALARAWAVRPEVLFLDEPTASLDPAATRAVEDMIMDFDKAGTKIIMTTHDLGQAHRLGEDILFLHKGCLKERTQAAKFFTTPDSPEGKAFLAGELLW
ncbi:MAG: ATP-binding cassette domain-containing protein [Rhodospirillaceae bacterium]|nr:ATP-binding cassette domain-containing protein [Rhodospirillaceae bacterium]